MYRSNDSRNSRTSVSLLGFSLSKILSMSGMSFCRKTSNGIRSDARTLTSDLFNYLHGNEHALQRVRVPSEAQEQARVQSRQQDALVEERKRIGAIGNALLLSQGYGSWSNWWRPKAFERLSKEVAGWIVKHLQRSRWGFTRAGPTNSPSQGGVEPKVARTPA